MARFSAQNPDGHHFVGTAEGLLQARSPLWTRDWRRDRDLSEEENERRRKAAVDASRQRWLATVKDTPAELSWRASNVARAQPGRATRIGHSWMWLVLMPPPPRARPSRADRRDRRDAAHRRWIERMNALEERHDRERLALEDRLARTRPEALRLEREARKAQMSEYPHWDGTPGPVNDPDTFWDTYAEMGEALGLQVSAAQIGSRAHSLRRLGSDAAADAMFEWAKLVQEREEFADRVRHEEAQVEVSDVESDDDDCDDDWDSDCGDGYFGDRFGWRDDDPYDRESQLVLMDGQGGALVMDDGEATLRHGHYAAAGDGALGARFGSLREGHCMWCGEAVPCGHDHRIHVAGVIGHIELACRRVPGMPLEVRTAAIEAVRSLGAEYSAHLDGIIGTPSAAAPAAGAEAGSATEE